MPYRPKGFFRRARLDFSLSLTIDRAIYDDWLKRNKKLRTKKHFKGLYWEDHMRLWIVDSVDVEDMFNEFTDELLKLFFDRIEDEELITQADRVNYLMSFVHQFPYSLDQESIGISEYARFPIETLYDKTGDCECLAILLAALIHRMDIAPVSIIKIVQSHIVGPDTSHAGVGVINNKDNSIRGTYIKYHGKRYYFCEAADIKAKAGELSKIFKKGTFFIYPIE